MADDGHPPMTTLEEAIDASRSRQREAGNFQYSGEHCSQCGAYVGVNRWGEYPEYGSHGCLWGNKARVITVPRSTRP